MRILLKLSGEALMGDQEMGLNHEATQKAAERVRELEQAGHEVAIVIGGGNIFRGIQQGPTLGVNRNSADHIGMLSTLINGVALSDALREVGCQVRMMSALECPPVAEPYKWDKVMRHLAQGRVVLFVGGTGHPFFTTDTCAALRASEINADLILKATLHVDGVYDKDPRKHPEAKKFPSISFKEVVDRKLGIIDLTAATLCMTNHIPIRVYNYHSASLVEAISGKDIGTLISGEGS